MSMITAQSKLVYRKKKAYQQIYMKYPQTMNREKLEKDIWDQVWNHTASQEAKWHIK